MSEEISLSPEFWDHLQKITPRILSQLDRDADSPTMGSFDRDFWHYKIRDFSSIILQQGMIILDVLKRLDMPDNEFYNNNLIENWIDGALNFWARSQLLSGGFNEYYPYEQGFPPTAFSLYAVGLILKSRNYREPKENIRSAIRKAINWLLQHPEKQALNQEMAGLAGIELCSRLNGINIDRNKLDERLNNFFKRQSPEGWFPEYDGPDLGYLSVTIDCLWDYFVSSADPRAEKAIAKAVAFIDGLVTTAGEIPTMINSRNTGYIVPYGLVRYAAKDPKAACLVYKLFSRLGSPKHFLRKIDDRYSCHYVYQSCFRSILYLNNVQPLKNESNKLHFSETFWDRSGILIIHRPDGNSIFVNAAKGGIVYVYNQSGLKDCDFGWRIKIKNKCAVTHWQDPTYTYQKQGNTIIVQGRMSNHSWVTPTPFKHMVLRAMSKLLGKKLIPLLKKVMIFKNQPTPVSFRTTIEVSAEKVHIQTEFSGDSELIKRLKPAPHYSLRHAASAGSFEMEELIPAPIWLEKNKGVWERIITLNQ